MMNTTTITSQMLLLIQSPPPRVLAQSPTTFNGLLGCQRTSPAMVSVARARGMPLTFIPGLPYRQSAINGDGLPSYV